MTTIMNPPRPLSKEERIFWHQALNRYCNVGEVRSFLPEEVNQLADRVASSYDKLWVEFNWETGSDPTLFGEKNGQAYLLARWGTDTFPLRTEEQLMISYRRHVESEAEYHNGILQVEWLVLNAVFVIGGAMTLFHNGWDMVGMGFLAAGLLLEKGRRWHKNRGLAYPMNIWEQRALKFVKRQQTASA